MPCKKQLLPDSCGYLDRAWTRTKSKQTCTPTQAKKTDPSTTSFPLQKTNTQNRRRYEPGFRPALYREAPIHRRCPLSLFLRHHHRTLKHTLKTWDTLSFVSKVDVISVPYGENTSPGTMEVMARVDLSESTEPVWKVSRLVSKMLTGNHCADGVGRQAAERTACCASSQSEYSVFKPLRGNYSSDRLKFTVLR